jgi:hypothetical protein
MMEIPGLRPAPFPSIRTADFARGKASGLRATAHSRMACCSLALRWRLIDDASSCRSHRRPYVGSVCAWANSHGADQFTATAGGGGAGGTRKRTFDLHQCAGRRACFGWCGAARGRRSLDRLLRQPCGRGGEADLADAAEAFQRTHDRYRITEINRLIQVRPTGRIGPCALALQLPLTSVKLSGNLHAVLNDAFALVNPDHPRVPPSLLQFAGDRRRESFPSVYINVIAGRFEDVLNSIAEQAPGFIWIIRPRMNPDQTVRSCTFDFIYRNASATTGWILPHESDRK